MFFSRGLVSFHMGVFLSEQKMTTSLAANGMTRMRVIRGMSTDLPCRGRMTHSQGLSWSLATPHLSWFLQNGQDLDGRGRHAVLMDKHEQK